MDGEGVARGWGRIWGEELSLGEGGLGGWMLGDEWGGIEKWGC